ncbi:substrate-binding periplasmic protein [Chitinimonas naiadis]
MRCPWFVMLSCLLTTTLAAGNPSGVPNTLNLIANYWEPYTGETLPQQGLASELVTTALKRAGYDSRITIAPWARALAMSYKGHADGVVAIWSTRERRDKLRFSEPYLSNRMVLLYRHGSYDGGKTLADIKGLRLGVGRGYDYNDAFIADTSFQVEPTDNVLQNLRKLAAKRVDLVLEDELIARYQLQQRLATLPELKQIVLNHTPLFTLPLHFAVSRQRPDADRIIEQFNTALAGMKADGSYDEIVRRHTQ